MENDPTVALYDFYGWLHTNRKRVLAGAIVAAAIAAIIAFVTWRNSEREAVANRALLGVPALLNEPMPVGDPASASQFLNISQAYAGTSAGTVAQLLAARELFLCGKYSEAQKEFSQFVADHSSHPLAAQASVGIAACMEAQGKISDAVQQYKKINLLYKENVSVLLPIRLTLGRLSEADNKPAEAVDYYKDLVNLRDRNDPWVMEAYERLRLLIAKHPELNPNPQQPPSAAPSPLAPTESELQLSPPAGATPPPLPPSAPPTLLPAPQPPVAPSNSPPPGAP
jgi:predicted negative regulator of RcsB-dependent stress response